MTITSGNLREQRQTRRQTFLLQPLLSASGDVVSHSRTTYQFHRCSSSAPQTLLLCNHTLAQSKRWNGSSLGARSRRGPLAQRTSGTTSSRVASSSILVYFCWGCPLRKRSLQPCGSNVRGTPSAERTGGQAKPQCRTNVGLPH